ncbi:SH3 domain-containing protein [Mesorhizobium sp. ASY16-5R]|uniref:SH3 domain-containing protein n=1 Tax=Mesorhizobium sp. ASY16-5R TaxID=3445772 RepID=UPI003FA15B71
MSNTLAKIIATAVLASMLALGAGAAGAATFAAWKVSGLKFGDTLNVRKYPSNRSQKQAAYPDGAVLQMTGRCTGGVNLLDISAQPGWKQQAATLRRWCEVWHDPARDGNFVTGWVYGRYITPY